ncbi:TonB-dependent receptor [Pedobacter sp. HMF7647]|uniref:TonB-dependent receptor n=1 Tax=Hufsiella arboris TaxID=2695275 RepID=A0A7K1YD31_9SPHI|nr:TonB-dependent receptor [Hufsiella arboris]MXV51958.1 TonB-dependent receptor [Hufsiella arboris]
MGTKGFKTLSLFILILTITFRAKSQTSIPSVSGIVKDSKSQPVSAVVIYLKGTGYKTETDAAGNFKINAPAGKYKLSISRLGFIEQTQNIELSAGNTLLLQDIILLDKGDMQEVRITRKTKSTEAKEQAYNLNVLDTKKLYNSASDLNRALNQTSGVRVREDGGVGSNFSFSLNGFSGRQVKFFLDGIPIDNFGQSLTLNNFPVNMSERIEVYKGVVPVTLGADALGGAVNIITRSNPNFLDISYGYGSFGTQKASVNHAYTNTKTGFTVRTNAFYNYSDNDYKVKVQPIDLQSGQKETEQEVNRFHDGYQSIGAQVEAGLSGKSYADKLLVGLIASGNDKDIQTGVTMDQVFGARTSNSSSLIPTLKYKKADLFIRGLDLGVYGAYNMTRNTFVDTTRLKYNWLGQTVPSSTAELSRSQLKNKDNEALATANLTYNLNQNHALSLNYVLTDFNRKSSDVENPDNITFLYPQKLSKQIGGLAWQTKYERFTATVFGKLYILNGRSFEQVSNGTGVAGYRESSTSTSDFGYGAAGAYFIRPQFQVKASYEHTYRLPEAVELLGDGLYTRRNSELKPESSNNINLGAVYSLNLSSAHKFDFEANYIFRNSHDFIRLDQAQTQPIDRQYINIGDVRTNGIEGEIRYSWRNNLHTAINLSYQNIIDKQKTFTSTNFQGTITSPNLGYGYRIPNTPYLFGNADLGYLFSEAGGRRNALDITYSLNFTQKYYLTPNQLGLNNKDDIPTQFAHNITANYTLQDGRYNVSLECRNFTNSDLFDNYLLQKPGRSFFLKLRYFISK